jgi:hypothetical protein
MTSNLISMTSMIMKWRKKHLAKAFWSSMLTCLIAFQPVLGGVIEAVPGQSIGVQLDLSVNAPQGYQITITPPSNISGWQLNPDQINEITGVLNVKANKDGWLVAVKDSNSITYGHMTDWDGLSYSTLKLANPMMVKAAREVTLPDGGVIQTGNKTKNPSQDIDVTFLQEVTDEDDSLPAGHAYNIVVTFLASYTP